ncbi:MAG TPA: oligosaccharide flippase family protein [Acidobacteriota bacterium]|jgi:O-antigen/teichoic acid export membrane protein
MQGIRGSIIYKFLGETTGRLISFIIVIIVARQLGPRALGIYALAGGVALYIAIIPDFGMHLFVTREIAADSTGRQRLVGGLLALKLAAGVAAALLLWIVVPLIFASKEEALTIAIMGTGGIFFGLVEFFTAVLRGYNAIITETTLLMMVRVCRTAAGAVTLLMGKGLIVFALVYAGVTLLGVLAALFLTTRWFVVPSLAFDWKEIRRWARQYVLIGTGLIGTFLYFRSDLFIIRFFRTPVEVGLYDAAYRAFDAVQMIPAVIVAVLYPRFAAENGGRYLKRALIDVGIFAPVLTAAIFFYGRLIIKLAYGKEFGASVDIVKIFYAILPVVFVNHVLTNYLIAIGRHRVYTRITLAALTLNVAINLLAIPQFGIKAAAFTTFPTQTFILICCLVTLLNRKERQAR